MAELTALGITLLTIGVAVLIGWGIGEIWVAYDNYRAKKNRRNHPKLVELEKKRIELCKEHSYWWNEKRVAEKKVDDCEQAIRYGGTTEVLAKEIEQAHEQYRNAFDNIQRLDPLIVEARFDENQYRAEHDIRHW